MNTDRQSEMMRGDSPMYVREYVYVHNAQFVKH